MFASHSIPSSKLRPVKAEHLKIAHCLYFRFDNPRYSEIWIQVKGTTSASLIAFKMSCLFAKIKIGTFFSSSSCIEL